MSLHADLPTGSHTAIDVAELHGKSHPKTTHQILPLIIRFDMAKNVFGTCEDDKNIMTLKDIIEAVVYR